MDNATIIAPEVPTVNEILFAITERELGPLEVLAIGGGEHITNNL